MAGFVTRLRKGWNAFLNRDPTLEYNYTVPGEMSSSVKPDRTRLTRGKEKTIVTAVYNRIAMDVSQTSIRHVLTDMPGPEGKYLKTLDTALNDRLTLDANLDQTSRAFFQDVVMSMFDEGVVCVVPTDASANIRRQSTFKIWAWRTAKIETWYPDRVKVEVYNDITGKKEEIVVPKESVAIIENPFYALMNERNSTVQRLTRKLSILDYVDEQSGYGKLNLIVQLPYAVRGETQQRQALKRKKALQQQLSDSNRYGVAYIDATEKVTQLNRSIDNNLLEQIEKLTTQFYTQLGITEAVMNGTANETEMLNYYNRTIEPILSAIVDEMKRKFLTKTAIAQGQSILFFRDPFKLVPANQLAEIADKYRRNCIMTSNEFRQEMGMMPSDDPKADMLVNDNMPQQDQIQAQDPNAVEDEGYYDEGQDG